MYANFANESQLFQEKSDVCCRLQEYYVDPGRKSRGAAFAFNNNINVVEDSILLDFVPFGFFGEYESFFDILNSVSNLSKAESILATYTRIGCFLDNDTAGRNAYANLQRMLGDRLQDMSVHYAGYNDLNEYLCKKLLSQSTEPIKEEKQVQSARRMMQPPKKKGLKI